MTRCSKGLIQQQRQPANGRATLQRFAVVGSKAQSGQMQALGYANQLAGNQANQLCRFAPR